MSTWIMSRTSLVYVHRSLSGLNLASVLELDPTAWQLTIMVLTYHCRFSHLIVISIVGTRLDLTINLIPFKLKKSHYSYSTHCITYTPCHSALHHLTRIIKLMISILSSSASLGFTSISTRSSIMWGLDF
jgi:hypothetical protein